MTSTLMTLDYEHLAAGELERAALCQTDDCRSRHLNRAAVYAHRAEKAGPGATQPGEVLNLIVALTTALDEAVRLGLTTAVLHIDRAIINLGGIGGGHLERTKAARASANNGSTSNNCSHLPRSVDRAFQKGT